ncbi:phosphotransferase [Paenibacillus sp. MER TA 81-3]|uniref:phosphotransferase family protein n=1 Tax=Paenibacillus sp. MER TA 81-3 TaxID=2939573 RepID=UPI00203BAAC1|nr:phosphotransferase [Paenibacillus sp. MER TA 81-3]MCM3340002.1 phosphotransferase [Paenibacillus sp. MER TA 81-3]
MTLHIPDRWLERAGHFPLVEQSKHWESLRQWSLSGVYRVTLLSGATVIAKWSGGKMKGEPDLYNDVLAPLHIERPCIYAAFEDETGCYMMMEDVGTDTLESKPSADAFLQAARQLAVIHRTATSFMKDGALAEEAFHRHYKGEDMFLDDLAYVTSHPFFAGSQRQVLERLVLLFPEHLERLYSEYPVTLVHNDYFPKNIIVQEEGQGVRVIDWTNSYLSPHLGDLYGLSQEAAAYGASREQMLQAYAEASGLYGNAELTLDWLVRVGGVCWFIHTIRWILDYGRHVISGSEAWIGDMLLDLEELTNSMSR